MKLPDGMKDFPEFQADNTAIRDAIDAVMQARKIGQVQCLYALGSICAAIIVNNKHPDAMLEEFNKVIQVCVARRPANE